MAVLMQRASNGQHQMQWVDDQQAASMEAGGWGYYNESDRNYVHSLPDNPVRYDSSGRPILEKYKGITDENGILGEQYVLGPGDSLYDFASNELAPNVRGSIDTLKARTGPGASPWAQAMFGQQGLDQQGQREAAIAQGKTAGADAWSKLAMRGGLSGGERERIAYQSEGDIANTLADINRQGAATRLGITGQDESQKLDLLKSMPGLESSYAEMLGRTKEYDISNKREDEKWNIANAITDVGNRSKYNLGAYDSAMQGWGAGKTADAQANSGGSWVCTEVGKVYKISKREFISLMRLRRHFTEISPKLAHIYYYQCEPLTKNMLASGFDFRNLIGFVKETVRLSRENMDAACAYYEAEIRKLLAQYWPQGLLLEVK